MTPAPCDLAAAAARAAIAAGRLTAVALAESCLARIAEREPEIGAFAALDADLWRAQAARADASGCPGPLGGLPVGIKDLAATRDWPTACGSPIYAGARLPFDAAVVSRARQAGAVIAGKTVTTEFAAFHPGPTRNPRDPARTPGGSSSGSAAAVAAGMLPLAVGTQTAGSIVRPASYCGVVGYKPSFGTVDPTGVKPYATSLDTVGVLARTVADCRLFVAAVSGVPLDPPRAVPARIGLCRSPAWELAEPEMRRAFAEDLPRRLAAAGIAAVELELPPLYAEALAAQRTIMAWESARCLAFEAEVHAGLLSEGLRVALAAGRTVDAAEMRAACACRDAAIAELPRHLAAAGVAALLAPAAAGVAPRFAAGTGSPDFNRLWTLLRGPCVGVPGLACAVSGLPLGVQVVAPIGADALALALGERIAAAL